MERMGMMVIAEAAKKLLDNGVAIIPLLPNAKKNHDTDILTRKYKVSDLIPDGNVGINLKKSNLYNKIWQAYAALLPIKTVGVMGDSRTYEYTCLLRAVTSEDGMTADFFSFNKNFMKLIIFKSLTE